MDAISYLKGFYDGEGSAGYNTKHHNRVVSASSTSPELIQLVLDLLYSLGFGPTIVPIKGRPGWADGQAVYLTNRRDLIRFARLIGFRKAENAERLRLIRQSYWRSRRKIRFAALTPRILQMRKEGITFQEIARRLGAPGRSTIQMVVMRAKANHL